MYRALEQARAHRPCADAEPDERRFALAGCLGRKGAPTGKMWEGELRVEDREKWGDGKGSARKFSKIKLGQAGARSRPMTTRGTARRMRALGETVERPPRRPVCACCLFTSSSFFSFSGGAACASWPTYHASCLVIIITSNTPFKSEQPEQGLACGRLGLVSAQKLQILLQFVHLLLLAALQCEAQVARGLHAAVGE